MHSKEDMVFNKYKKGYDNGRNYYVDRGVRDTNIYSKKIDFY